MQEFFWLFSNPILQETRHDTLTAFGNKLWQQDGSINLKILDQNRNGSWVLKEESEEPPTLVWAVEKEQLPW